jgi:hypothetical protein
MHAQHAVFFRCCRNSFANKFFCHPNRKAEFSRRYFLAAALFRVHNRPDSRLSK